MPKLNAKQKSWFKEYVEAAKDANEDLAFLAENLGEDLVTDYSESSLEAAERLYWKVHREGLPAEFGSIEDFAELIGRYLGQCIVERCGAKWVQTTEANHRHGQACLDGFGNAAWGKVYPIELARNLPTLRQTNPSFPGVDNHRVFAEQFRRATVAARKAGLIG